VIGTRSNDARDRGAAAVELPLAVGLLLLPISMVVMLVPQWPERQTVARAAAKEAATMLANAPDAATGMQRASEAVSAAAAEPRPAARLDVRRVLRRLVSSMHGDGVRQRRHPCDRRATRRNGRVHSSGRRQARRGSTTTEASAGRRTP
jgi:hypothetical protein